MIISESTTLNVLIVDDSALMRKLIAKSLGTIDNIIINATEAGNGMEALATLERNGEQFDLILCDLNMPRLNGLSLLRNVKGTPELQDTPFIIITADSSDAITSQALREGATGIISKPFSSEKLIEMISNCSKVSA